MSLERIIAEKQKSVASRIENRPLRTFEKVLQPSRRSLTESLRRRGTGFILECKRRSPSEGVLSQHFNPGSLARDYAEVADAISVLTDEPFFGGTFEDLREVRSAVDLPVLCKDFVVAPYQIYEARLWEADAVLLIASILQKHDLKRCMDITTQLGMEAIIEVHDAAELELAVDCGASILGINNRNLKTMELNLGVTEALAPLAPANLLKISESGIRTHADVRRLRPLVDAFLVGSSLMRQENIPQAARELVYGRVKVCGLTRPEDARAAWKAGAVWGGLIFAPGSPRAVTLAQARKLQTVAPLRWTGVFVNESPAVIEDIATNLGLDAVQLHGEETPEQVQAIKKRLSCEVWKSVAPKRGKLPKIEETGADRIVFDNQVAGKKGGTGKPFDWKMLKGYPDPDRVVLAGGIQIDNILEAMQIGTWAVDVNSGLEDQPGVKNPAMIHALFDKLRKGSKG